MATDRREYHKEYLKGLKEIRFRVKPEKFEKMQAAAKEQGYASMRQFFLAAIKEKMGRVNT